MTFNHFFFKFCHSIAHKMIIGNTKAKGLVYINLYFIAHAMITMTTAS